MRNAQTATLNPTTTVKHISRNRLLHLAGLLLLPVLFVLVDFAAGRDVVCSGIVLDKYYVPEQIHLTKVRELSKDGHETSRLSSEIEPASWEILTQSNSGESLRLQCEREVYYAKSVGEAIEYISVQGFLTNWVYKYRGITSSIQTSPAAR